MNKNQGQELKKLLRKVAFFAMIIVIGFGWYTKQNTNSQKTVEEKKQETQKGKMVLRDNPEMEIVEGSMINLDFSGTYNGEDVGSSENVDVTVGGGKLNKSFESQLIGHHPGDEFTIQVKMSERLAVKKEYRGKVADVKVKINGIYEVIE